MDFENFILPSDICSESIVKFSSYHFDLGKLVSYLENTSVSKAFRCIGVKDPSMLSITLIPSVVTLPLESFKLSVKTACQPS